MFSKKSAERTILRTVLSLFQVYDDTTIAGDKEMDASTELVFIGSLNSITMTRPATTPAEPSTGAVEKTVGGVVSRLTIMEFITSEFPALSTE